jgi:hypothetical protein
MVFLNLQASCAARLTVLRRALAAGIWAAWALSALSVHGQPPPDVLTDEEKALTASIQEERRKDHEEAVKRALDEYRQALREAKNPSERAAALWKLAETETDPRLLPELTRALADAEVMRREAMGALSRYRDDEKAAQALVRLLPTNERDPALLEKNLDALGNVGHPATAPAVVRYLKDKNAPVAAAAARALAKMKTPGAIEPLLSAWEEIEAIKDKKAKEDRLKGMQGPLSIALVKLTGQSFATPAEYRVWWIQHRATHKLKERPPPVLCKKHFGPIRLPGKPPPRGALVYEVWAGLKGSKINDLLTRTNQFATPPGQTHELLEFEAPENCGDRYGARIRGYLHPPADGDYTFWLASHDESQLALSPDENPANKAVIASTPAVKPRAWESNEGSRSEPITLQAGRRYYLEVLHKEGGRNGHLSVAWDPPKGRRELIPGACLSPFLTAEEIAKEAAARPAEDPAQAQPAVAPIAGLRFYRAVNFNGSAVTVDGNKWESWSTNVATPNCIVTGKPFENPSGPLEPAVEGDKERMLRSGVTNTGMLSVVLCVVPKGRYHVFMYIWEGENPKRFAVTLQDKEVASDLSTGLAGLWSRLGPWTVDVAEGTLTLLCTGGTVNLCGIEMWREGDKK